MSALTICRKTNIHRSTNIHENTVDKKVITNYINTFRNIFGTYLNNGVGANITISDLSSSVFICIVLEVGTLDSTSFGRKFNNLRKAFIHYGFINSLAEFGRTEGTNVVLQKNKIALIKDKNIQYWKEGMAEYDAREIAQHIIKSNSKDGVV